jgi:type VI secretion system protein ImpH
MDATLGRETDAVAFTSALAEAPYRFDFYQTLRRLECLYESKPRWGRALRPIDEPIRFGQDPDLSFAPAPLAALETSPGGRAARLQVRLFGLLGPNGPLPIHITEYARERLRNAGDPTLSRFLDLLHHRFITLFYRAWAQAQPATNRDRPKDDRFALYVGAFFGVAPAAFRDRDRLPDLAKYFHAGSLIRQVRNAEGLKGVLEHFFRVPVRIQEFVGHWMHLDVAERSRLTARSAPLGVGGVLGSRVWDRQHKFRIHLGPLTLPQYESFLPTPAGPVVPGRASGVVADGQPGQLARLVDWVRLYCCLEHDWDVRLTLRHDEVPRLRLASPVRPGNGGGRLGWTTWIGRRRTAADAADLCLDAEAFVTTGRTLA